MPTVGGDPGQEPRRKQLLPAPRAPNLSWLLFPFPHNCSRPTPTASVRPLCSWNWVTRWHLCCSLASSLIPLPMARDLGICSGQVETLREQSVWGHHRHLTRLPRQPGGGQPCECVQCPQTTPPHVAEGGGFHATCILL